MESGKQRTRSIKYSFLNFCSLIFHRDLTCVLHRHDTNSWSVFCVFYHAYGVVRSLFTGSDLRLTCVQHNRSRSLHGNSYTMSTHLRVEFVVLVKLVKRYLVDVGVLWRSSVSLIFGWLLIISLLELFFFPNDCMSYAKT